MSAAICEETPGLFQILLSQVGGLWKDWIRDMTAKALPGNLHENRFSMSGACPHCNLPSVFMPVTSVYTEQGPAVNGVPQLICIAVMQCQGCLKHILGSAGRLGPTNQPSTYRYIEHFPLGKPNDSSAPEIPENIRLDFSEALRCRFVDAHNATVEMCRRAVQASCFQLGAPNDKLVKQIDWLAAQGTITTPLRDMAHRVRLGGNLGAHPPEDPDDPTEIIIDVKYADAVIEFTREFFQHVYVMPERLKKFIFNK